MIRTGWEILETNEWTRKGNGKSQKNTNIDIVATRGFEEDTVEISQLEYNPNMSDHKPILIKIKDLQKKG